MHSTHVPRWLIAGFIIFALLGFADASFLTAEHARGVLPPCGASGGCETVLTSRYATVAGFPTSVLGMLYYGTLLVALIAYVDTRDRRILRGAAWFTICGLVASAYFVALQLFVIHALCRYCIVSAASSTILFGLGAYTLRIE